MPHNRHNLQSCNKKKGPQYALHTTNHKEVEVLVAKVKQGEEEEKEATVTRSRLRSHHNRKRCSSLPDRFGLGTRTRMEVGTTVEEGAAVVAAEAPVGQAEGGGAATAVVYREQSRPQRASCCQCIHLMSSSPSRSHPLIRHSHGRIAAHPCPLAHLSTTEDQ